MCTQTIEQTNNVILQQDYGTDFLKRTIANFLNIFEEEEVKQRSQEKPSSKNDN